MGGPTLLTESQGVPDLREGISGRDVAHIPRKVQGIVVASHRSGRLPVIAPSPDPDPRPKPPRAALPGLRAPTHSLYPVMQLRSALHARLCVPAKVPNSAALQSGPASGCAEPRPPPNELARATHGAGPTSAGKAAGAPRHVHKGNRGLTGEGGWATPQ